MTNLPKTLPNPTQYSAAKLLSELKPYCHNKFTGRVDFQSSSGWRCSLYLNLGNIVWASGGLHPIRRWRRLMNGYCPQALAQLPSIREADRFECWDYHVLTVLVQRGQVTDEQVLAIVEDLVVEVLFDFLQVFTNQSKVQTASDERQFRIQDRIGLRPSETNTSLLRQKWTLEIDPMLVRVRENWKQWTQAGFTAWLPDLAPTIVQPERLKQQVPAATYRQLTTSINGKNSLRELAVFTKREPLAVARALLPYLRQKLIKLVEVPDLKIPKSPPPKSQKNPRLELIACIDDSQRVCDALETIVSKAGYECLTICNPLEALPLLIQRKPKLIFLDLMMPTINGYELCSQIRRLPGFEETPVVILTSNDGIVDRVRAKLVGATDFMTKPVQGTKVVGAARRYLERRTAVSP